jgi:bifunctional non-homologous end joining protein LigD
MSVPSFRPPMLATLSERSVSGDGWLFERKLDGIRLIAVRDGERLRLFTRNRANHTLRYPELSEKLLAQPCQQFVLDGEVVALEPLHLEPLVLEPLDLEGDRTSFSRLQQRSGLSDPAAIRRSGVEVTYYVFDLLHSNGKDHHLEPLIQRKAALRQVIRFEDPLRLCEHEVTGDLERACERGWEGLVAKRAASTYRSGRSRSWLKLKCRSRAEFMIGGYTEPNRSRVGLGALLVGLPQGEHLEYAGRVGTGFDRSTLEQLAAMLDERRQPSCPFRPVPDLPRNAHWVRPDLVCEVGFSEWTASHRLRHPRYRGLRKQ